VAVPYVLKESEEMAAAAECKDGDIHTACARAGRGDDLYGTPVDKDRGGLTRFELH